MKTTAALIAALLLGVVWLGARASSGGQPVAVEPVPQGLQAPGAGDQDDMAIWVHGGDRSQSTVIGSDKKAAAVYVYDLRGNVLQTLRDLGEPGNIDVRYDFPLGGQRVDIVVFNDRDPAPYRLRVLKVDPVTRHLTPIDDGTIVTGANYGSCLYRSPASGKFYAFTTAKGSGTSEQWELDGSGGTVRGTRVRTFTIGSQTEGCVADDAYRRVYMAEEKHGVWAFGAEPGDASARTAVDDTGNLNPDVEGVTIYRASDGKGYLIVSSQGADEFDVYDRLPEAGGRHRFRGTFTLRGVGKTDGVDVTSVGLGGAFAEGLLVAHNGTRATALSLARWADIARALKLAPPDPATEAGPVDAGRRQPGAPG